MNDRRATRGLMTIISLAAAWAALGIPSAFGQQDIGYHPINPTEAGKTITLTGRDLTIDEVIEVARGGAKVQLSPEAKQRELDNFGLLLEAPAEGISVYWFNREPGQNREKRLFTGDPM